MLRTSNWDFHQAVFRKNFGDLKQSLLHPGGCERPPPTGLLALIGGMIGLKASSEATGTHTNADQAVNRTLFAAVHKAVPTGTAIVSARWAVRRTIDAAVSEAGWGDPEHLALQDFLCTYEPLRVEV